MPTIEALIEGERRGLLNERNTAILSEARKRGLAPDVASAPTQTEPPELERFTQETRAPGPGFVASMFSELPGVEKAQEFIENAEPGETTGQIIGGIAGARLGHPIKGSIAGGTIGKGVEIGIRKLLGADAPENKDIPYELGKSAAVSAGVELGGRLGFKIAGKVLHPFSSKVTPMAKRANKFLKSIKTTLLPSEATESRVLDVLQNISENSLVGGSFIRNFKLNRISAINQYADEFIDTFGARLSPDDLGVIILRDQKESLNIIKEMAKPLYNKVDELTQGLHKIVKGNMIAPGVRTTSKVGIINIKNAKKFAGNVAKTSKEIKGFGADLSGGHLADDILGQSDHLSFRAAQDLRSLLLKRADELSITNKGAPAIGFARKMAGMIDEAIEKGLSENSPEALAIWREANNIDKSGRNQFNNKLIRRLVKIADQNFGNNPEGIVKQIFKPNSISRIKVLKNSLDQETWKKVKGWVATDLIAKSTSKTDQLLKGANLEAAMFGRNGLGEKAMAEIFTAKEVSSLREFANALKVSQEKQAEGLGRMWIQLTQAAAFVGLFTGNVTGLSTFVTVGPAVIGKILTNPKTSKILTEGLKLPTGSKQAAILFARLTASLAEAGIEYKEGFAEPPGFRKPKSPQGKTIPAK